MSRVWRVVAVLALAAPLALTACGGDDGPRFGSASPGGPPTSAAPPVPFEFTVMPPADTKGLPISTEVGTLVKGGTVTSVTLTETGGGTQIAGALRDDQTSWVPAAPLKYSKSYTATVTATSAVGQVETKTTTFTTMAKSGQTTGTGLYLFDDREYGVAMPVVVEFHPGVKKEDRAGVQTRLFVSTDPPQPGAWHWVENGTQAYYRAPDYWSPGTKLSVRIAVAGHPTGKGRYGDMDRKATAKIGEKLVMEVDNATKQMSVFKNDQLVKTMPVSLGKASTPSSSGTMIVMEKKEETVFDTFAELGPEEGYRTDIQFAQRLTWGGEYIHAAPWSVNDQGRRNVSHGCVNVATENARWLFQQTKIGDPITVKGTERKLQAGNGWTAWNLTWDEFVKGSALPVPADLGPRSAEPGATPTAAAG